MYGSMGRLRKPIAVAAAVWVVAVYGCAGSGPRPEDDDRSAIDSRVLLYDAVVLEFPGQNDTEQDIAARSAGAGAREGTDMMLAAPVGCMQAGMLYGFCLAMAPLFPVIAASRVQDPEDSLRELQSLAEQIAAAQLPQRFRELVRQRAVLAGLPMGKTDPSTGRVIRLVAELGTLRLEHSGYRGGSIAVTQPYRFTVVAADGSTLGSTIGSRGESFDVDEWWADGSVALELTLTRWIEGIADEGLRDTLVEWQPDVVLAHRFPASTPRRNLIGILQEIWPRVDSATPTLRWQALADALPADVLAHVTDVTYELEIVGAQEPQPRRVAGLAQPEYTVAEPLAPCARYLWRPRARFRYQGVMHTTSLRTRRWAEGVYVDDHYVLNAPGTDCR